MTQGEKVAQVALRFGANDFGSTMLEENVVAATGVHFRLEMERIVELIRDAGFLPAQRSHGGEFFCNTLWAEIDDWIDDRNAEITQRANARL